MNIVNFLSCAIIYIMGQCGMSTGGARRRNRSRRHGRSRRVKRVARRSRSKRTTRRRQRRTSFFGLFKL